MNQQKAANEVGNLIQIKELSLLLKILASLSGCDNAEAFADALDDSEEKDQLSVSSVQRWFAGEHRPNTKHRKLIIRFVDRNKKNLTFEAFGELKVHILSLLRSRKLGSAAGMGHFAKSNSYKIRGYNDLVKAKIPIVDAIRQVFDLDKRVYDDITVDNEGTVEQWIPVYINHPVDWCLLYFRKRIIGYWQISIFNPQFYNLARAGKLMEGIMDHSVCYEMVDIPGIYDLYAMSICLDQEHRRRQPRMMLLRSFFEVIEYYAKSGVFFDEVLTNAYSEEGRAMCRSFRMEYLRDHNHLGKMYAGHMSDIINRCRGYLESDFGKMINLYIEAGLI